MRHSPACRGLPGTSPSGPISWPCSQRSIVFSVSDGRVEREMRQMSEGRGEERAEEGGAIRPEPEPVPPATPEPPRPQRRSRGAAPWLAALLILVVAGIALSPFWAPALAPLLPWGSRPDASAEKYAALVARVAAIEQRPAHASVDLGPMKSA